jgi:hypothetical protein
MLKIDGNPTSQQGDIFTTEETVSSESSKSNKDDNSSQESVSPDPTQTEGAGQPKQATSSPTNLIESRGTSRDAETTDTQIKSSDALTDRSLANSTNPNARVSLISPVRFDPGDLNILEDQDSVNDSEIERLLESEHGGEPEITRSGTGELEGIDGGPTVCPQGETKPTPQTDYYIGENLKNRDPPYSPTYGPHRHEENKSKGEWRSSAQGSELHEITVVRPSPTYDRKGDGKYEEKRECLSTKVKSPSPFDYTPHKKTGDDEYYSSIFNTARPSFLPSTNVAEVRGLLSIDRDTFSGDVLSDSFANRNVTLRRETRSRFNIALNQNYPFHVSGKTMNTPSDEFKLVTEHLPDPVSGQPIAIDSTWTEQAIYDYIVTEQCLLLKERHDLNEEVRTLEGQSANLSDDDPIIQEQYDTKINALRGRKELVTACLSAYRESIERLDALKAKHGSSSNKGFWHIKKAQSPATQAPKTSMATSHRASTPVRGGSPPPPGPNPFTPNPARRAGGYGNTVTSYNIAIIKPTSFTGEDALVDVEDFWSQYKLWLDYHEDVFPTDYDKVCSLRFVLAGDASRWFGKTIIDANDPTSTITLPADLAALQIVFYAKYKPVETRTALKGKIATLKYAPGCNIKTLANKYNTLSEKLNYSKDDSLEGFLKLFPSEIVMFATSNGATTVDAVCQAVVTYQNFCENVSAVNMLTAFKAVTFQDSPEEAKTDTEACTLCKKQHPMKKCPVFTEAFATHYLMNNESLNSIRKDKSPEYTYRSRRSSSGERYSKSRADRTRDHSGEKPSSNDRGREKYDRTDEKKVRPSSYDRNYHRDNRHRDNKSPGRYGNSYGFTKIRDASNERYNRREASGERYDRREASNDRYSRRDKSPYIAKPHDRPSRYSEYSDYRDQNRSSRYNDYAPPPYDGPRDSYNENRYRGQSYNRGRNRGRFTYNRGFRNRGYRYPRGSGNRNWQNSPSWQQNGQNGPPSYNSNVSLPPNIQTYMPDTQVGSYQLVPMSGARMSVAKVTSKESTPGEESNL